MEEQKGVDPLWRMAFVSRWLLAFSASPFSPALPGCSCFNWESLKWVQQVKAAVTEFGKLNPPPVIVMPPVVIKAVLETTVYN